jgi:8-oxo-dGTP pyrophosphatase MutT (NUDIX family)
LTSASRDPAAGEPVTKNLDGNGADGASVPTPVSADGVPDWLVPLAGAAAHMPVPAALRPPAGRGRAAAVLILFGDGPDGPDLLLIERSADLRKHPGQPAFPGGAIDEADGGPVAAALREAQEETGVEPAGVTVLAVMPELYIWRSDYRVTPVLGWWHSPVPVAPGDPAEIAAVVRVPVADLVSPANRIMIRYPDGRAQPAFLVAGLVVWGFTAMVLDRLLVLAGWERPWDRDQLTDLPASDRPTGWPLPGA